MAVKIRLRRMGKKKAPFYRVVVADSRSPRDGKFIEEIGTYDPNQDPSVFKFDEESAKKWLANGAKPTETVGKLLKEAGIMEKFLQNPLLIIRNRSLLQRLNRIMKFSWF